MIFKIHGLIALKESQKDTTFLLDAPDEKVAKTICSKYSIAVFTIEPFTQPIESFSKAYLRFNFEKQSYTLYSDIPKARDLYDLYRDTGLDIIYINNSTTPLKDEDIPRVLEKLVSDYNTAHAAKSEKDKSYITQITDKVLERGEEELQEVKKLAAKAVEESEATINNMDAKDKQTAHMLKVRNTIEELKRVRMGSNIIKIRDQMTQVYKMMEGIEMQYLEEQKESEVQIIEGSTVTYLDIVSEWDKYKKTMTLQRAKASGGGGLNYYAVFGSLGLYQKLIGKELQHKFTNVIVIIDGLYNILIMFVMMTIIWLVLLQLFNTIAFKGSFFTSAFIDVGIMGICSAILMKFKKPNLINLIIIGPICVGLYFLLHSFIYANFGL